ncbi:MAG: helix-turn-helix transcriptional regulator [Balneolaceae bacterium]|nr:helix-turn-helix transcriptional regulator [Balneolaceae bacterium]MBO6546529.1 helix-turn-helix transcriptional regulator [Balneolaceae bacterium]MBO6648888.1 helix-turn-helix transcriptional regulator [Balneolaceae bacterium]
MELSILNFLIAFGALQALFLSFIVLSTNKKSRFRKFFAFFLIIEGFELLERFLVETDLISFVPHLLGISYSLSFLKPPLIYFITLSVTDSKFQFTKTSYLHFIPFLIILTFNIPFYSLEATEKLLSVQAFMKYIPSYTDFNFYFSLAMFAYIGTYILISVRLLQKFKKFVRNNSLSNWFFTILVLYSGFLFLHLIFFILQPLLEVGFGFINQISLLSMSFIIQSIAYKLISKSSILSKTPPDISNLERRLEIEQLIAQKLETDKVHLDESLNLDSFARLIKLSPTEVSEIINQKFGCSFKKMIAKYRVKEAKKVMDQNKNTNIKLIDIAYDSGFSNKVSFYRAFKEYEGLSPSAYFEKIKDL